MANYNFFISLILTTSFVNLLLLTEGHAKVNGMNPVLFEGDIAGFDASVLAASTREKTRPTKHLCLALYYTGQIARNGVRDEHLRWPKGIVFYKISPSYTLGQQINILQAMKGFEDSTCVRFYKRTNETSFIHISTGGQSSWSYVGYRSNEQFISLTPSDSSFVGNIQHELMHALGFLHEQSRIDRDEYVDIFWDNILSERIDQFQKYSHVEISSFGQPYDFDPILHYSSDAFAKNLSRLTILPKEKFKHNIIGQRRGLSQIDVKKINMMYNCSTLLSSSSSFPNVLNEPKPRYSLITLTIDWTLENFKSFSNETTLYSPSVSSAEIGLTDVDGDWCIQLYPNKMKDSQRYFAPFVTRRGGSKGNATLIALTIQIIDALGNILYTVTEPNVQKVLTLEDTWGWPTYIHHDRLLNANGMQTFVTNGALILRTIIQLRNTASTAASISTHLSRSYTFSTYTAPNMINLTIDWTLENFRSYLNKADIYSPSVSSAEIGLTDADGDWCIHLKPNTTNYYKQYIGVYISRLSGSKGNATANFTIHILDGLSNILASKRTESGIIAPTYISCGYKNYWGWENYFQHERLLDLSQEQKYLTNGALILRASIQFRSSVGSVLSGSTQPSRNYTFTTRTGPSLINLTIDWTLKNFRLHLNKTDIYSPSVSSAEIGLTDADGNWCIWLQPDTKKDSQNFIDLYICRRNGSKGNVTAINYGIHILNARGDILVGLTDIVPKVFTPTYLSSEYNNVWGWPTYLHHDQLLNTAGKQQYLTNGSLILRAFIQFEGPVRALRTDKVARVSLDFKTSAN